MRTAPVRPGSRLTSGCVRRVAGGEAEREGGADRGLGGRPDASAEVLDDLAADCQADAGALVGFAGVEPAEDLEDTLPMSILESDAVVPNREHPLAPFSFGADAHFQGSLAPELHRVGEQVLKESFQLRLVGPEFGHVPDLAGRARAVSDRLGGPLDDALDGDEFEPW